MLPQPLHPAVVHFPVVLVVLLPVVALVAVLAIRRGVGVRGAWLPVVAVSAGLTVASWAAVETGEREEEAVERVVSRDAFHEHEDRAKLFLPLTVIGLVVVSAGLLAGKPGEVIRAAAVVTGVGLAIVGYMVGHSGGELVYEHGAAAAYVQPNTISGAGPVDGGERHEDEGEGPERDRR
jgi:uncharacterized membrane protein